MAIRDVENVKISKGNIFTVQQHLTPLSIPLSSACNVLYLNSVETESLTGPQAIAKATDATVGRSPRPAATVVQFKVTSQGITLTDSQRR